MILFEFVGIFVTLLGAGGFISILYSSVNNDDLGEGFLVAYVLLSLIFTMTIVGFVNVPEQFGYTKIETVQEATNNG